MMVMFAVDCVVSRTVGCFYFYIFFNLSLVDVLPWCKVTVNV